MENYDEERGTGNGERGTGNGERGAGKEERGVSLLLLLWKTAGNRPV